jgi:hypothetical protein
VIRFTSEFSAAELQKGRESQEQTGLPNPSNTTKFQNSSNFITKAKGYRLRDY